MNVNDEILKIWNTHKDDISDLLGKVDPSQKMLAPLFYPNIQEIKNTILFIGLNPSYNENMIDKLSGNQNLTELLKNWHDLNQDEIEAIIEFDTSVKEVDEKGLKTKYPYFQRFQYIRPLAKVNLRASNSPFQQLNSFLDQSVSVYFYSVLLISENV